MEETLPVLCLISGLQYLFFPDLKVGIAGFSPLEPVQHVHHGLCDSQAFSRLSSGSVHHGAFSFHHCLSQFFPVNLTLDIYMHLTGFASLKNLTTTALKLFYTYR